MNFLLIGDPHFKIDNAYECNQFIEEVYKLVKETKYDKIIILGDILDTHEKINLRPFYRAIEFIINLSKISKTYLLIGNHDRINNSIYLTDEHPFIGLKNVENIVVVDKVIKEDNIIYVPYVPTGRFNEALETIQYKEEKIDLIFAHQEFQNSIFQNQGDLAPKNISIYSGHIHNSVRLDNVFYVGTPFQHSFYDDPEKFILNLKIKNKKIKEEKIYLKIIKKRVEEITASQLLDYKIDENYITKLLIKADKKLLNNKKIQEILKHPKIKYKISYNKELKDKKEIKIIKEVSYQKLLEDRLKKETKEVQKLYNIIK